MRKTVFLVAFILFATNSFCQLNENGQQYSKELNNLMAAVGSYDLMIDKYQNQLNQAQEEMLEYELELISTKLKMYGEPKSQTNSSALVYHSAMALQYNEAYEQAEWVYHIISPKIAEGKQGRTNDFREDSLVASGTAVEADYFIKKEVNGETEYDGFGFDRGHLAPSADFRWSKKALSESYYYSNMSPQRPEFNRGAWADLEGLIRGYVMRANHEVLVVTGPVFTKKMEVIERSINKVAIPNHFYKVVLDPFNKTGIAFLMPNMECKNSLSSYAVSIDEIEEITGLDFFTNLEESFENEVESQTDFYSLFPLSEGDAEPIPFDELPRNSVNTTMIKTHINSEFTVCGTVVKTYTSKNDNLFLTIDKNFPNQVLSVSIFKANQVNFSYNPEYVLKDKKACFTGFISTFNGVPSISIKKEEQIRILSE